MRHIAAIAVSALVCSGCFGQSDQERVEAQVAKRFGPKAMALCNGGYDFAKSHWTCQISIEGEDVWHSDCEAWVNDDLKIVRFRTC
jgi:hypothetical protein